METKIIDGGNKITSADKLFLRAWDETARQIHQRIPLPFQSRTRPCLIVCGFVKRAEAAQGFSPCVVKFPFSDRQRKCPLNFKSSACADTSMAAANIRLNAIFKKGVSAYSSFYFNLALMQKNATQISGRYSFHLLHFFAAHDRFSIPLFKNSVNPFFVSGNL